MTLKKKIMISNIMIIVVPVILLLILLGIFIHTHSGMYMDPMKDSTDGSGSMYGVQYTLYLYENLLSDLDLEADLQSDHDAPDLLYPTQVRKIQELSEMGFHLQIFSGSELLFVNMDENDLRYLEKSTEKAAGSKESIDCFDDVIIIRDKIERDHKIYFVNAVYDEKRVNIGMQESLLPVYTVSPQLLFGFLLIVSASIIITGFFLTSWLNRSVIQPLEILTYGAKEISDGNLNTQIEYDRCDEFGVVCHEFDQMRIRLRASEEERERYEEKKKNLMIGISHDLRSPLTSIKGYTEGLRDGIANTEEKKERYYHAILTKTDEMKHLLESMSLLVRLDHPEYKYRLQKVSINEFLSQFISEEADFAEKNHVMIGYTCHATDTEVYADIHEMRRVFVNLLENAVKYRTKDSSVIQIDVRENTDSETVEIRFSDNGPGVDEEQLAYLFDSFFRSDQSRIKPENGSGLGLAVVKSIVEGHKGSVKAYNDNGLGILITLPKV